jgi:hypothetical protein
MFVRKNSLLSYSIKNLLLFILLLSIVIPTISSENTPPSKMSTINPSCTIFTMAIGDKVFYGNNEDWRQQELRLWYIPAQNISTMGGERSFMVQS